MNIGIVLAGGMSKGAYEIGCINAIVEYFGRESIRCISASSIGTLVSYAFVSDQMELLVQRLKEVDVKQSGKFFPALSGNSELNLKIRDFVPGGNAVTSHMYATIWNFTERRVDYVPFHTLTDEAAKNYLCAAIAIPLFNKGVRLNGCTLFDGAFIDNIPVYPLMDEELDYIFCIYFDPHSCLFENEAFDGKIIKLHNFPNKKRWDSFVFDPERMDGMIDYGYGYTKNMIGRVFSCDSSGEIRRRIDLLNASSADNVKRRLTCDVILTNINKMTARYARRNIT